MTGKMQVTIDKKACPVCGNEYRTSNPIEPYIVEGHKVILTIYKCTNPECGNEYFSEDPTE